MKKQIALVLFLGICIVAESQKKTFIVDETPVGLGISIQDVQRQVKKQNLFNSLISPPTIIESKKNEKGELYVKLYINADRINVIATKINNKNKNFYKAFQKISFVHDDKVDVTSPLLSEELVEVTPDKGERSYFQILTSRASAKAIYEYSIAEATSGKIVSTLKIEYAFPKPEPEILTIDKDIITQNEGRPSDNVYYDSLTYLYFKEEIISKNLVKTSFDPVTNLPTQLVLPNDINSIFIRFKRLIGYGESSNYLEYKFSTDNLWKTTINKANPFIILRNLKVGKYKIQVRYPEETNGVWEYEFEIKPVWTQTTFFKVFIGSLITAFFCFILFAINYKRQQRKLKNEVSKRKQLQTQITSLRSQLHPHFIFNALNSIQGLVNKNNIEDASLYISKFGSLLHEILEKSDKAMHPLATEIRQIEYYLQLEQLRFKFEYKIHIGNNINTSEIDIPVMLLQPYVENAIKHGIIEKRENGIIGLNFVRKGAELIIDISDNGKGYEVNAKPGHGNSLIDERVRALNKFLKGQQIDVKVLSEADKGTCVSINFYNWF